MKKVFLVLAILAAGLWSGGCDNGVSNGTPRDFTQTVMEPTLISATPQANGEIKYDILWPAWEIGLGKSWGNIGIQVNDGPIDTLDPATDRIGYHSTFTAVDGNYYFHVGRFNWITPDNVDWGNINNIPKKWLRYYKGEPRVGVTFRGVNMDTIVEPPLTILKAIIVVSKHEAATGDEIWFDGSQSTANANPKSEIIIWDWDFGDGTVANGRAVSHAYKLAGSYIVSLTVTDDQGNKHTAQTEISVVPTVGPGEFGDSYHRFHFDFLRNIVLAYYNFNKAAVNQLGSKPNVFGNFNGPEQPWKLYYVGADLQFDLFHTGWGYVEIPLTKPIIALKSGFSQWYDGSVDMPDFSRSNFDHMKYGMYFNGQDLSVIIYSSGQIEKGP
jgi:hypothetical protein